MRDPTVTMCNISYFGTGGGKSTTHAICVLPNNIVHQKFYLFLWFWLLFITTVTAGHQLYRIALYVLPSFRSFVTKRFWTGITLCTLVGGHA